MLAECSAPAAHHPVPTAPTRLSVAELTSGAAGVGVFASLKPTGSGKRKGTNPMKQQLAATATLNVSCGTTNIAVSDCDNSLNIAANAHNVSTTVAAAAAANNIDQIPLDLSLRGISAASKRVKSELDVADSGNTGMVINKKVILSVPQYRKVHHHHNNSPLFSSEHQNHPLYAPVTCSNLELEKLTAKNSLTITPVMKPELDNNCNEMIKTTSSHHLLSTSVSADSSAALLSADSSAALVQRLLATHPQSFLAIQQLKQAATTMLTQQAAGGQPLSPTTELELRHTLWGSLIPAVSAAAAAAVVSPASTESSKVCLAQPPPGVSPPQQAADSTQLSADDKKKIHKCDFSGCGKESRWISIYKFYFKGS